MKMLSLQKKQKVCQRHITSYSYQSKKRWNTESNPHYKVDKVEGESVQRRRMFLHAFQQNIICMTAEA